LLNLLLPQKLSAVSYQLSAQEAKALGITKYYGIGTVASGKNALIKKYSDDSIGARR
jgi:hypothetical protein